MKIECKIHRPGGSVIDIGGKEYEFTPDANGAHVADVEDDDHIARFLSIPEGYRIHKESGPVAATASQLGLTSKPATLAAPFAPVSAIEMLLSSDVHPASFEIHDKRYALGDIVALAHTKSGLSVTGWNEQSDDARAIAIDEQLDAMEDAGPVQDEPPAQQPQPPVDESAVRAELVALYEAKFGKKPHHNAGVDKIRAALAE